MDRAHMISKIGKKWQIASLAAFAILLMLPSLLWGPGLTHSFGYNLIWTREMADEMARGNLYPRWFPGSFDGLGSPTFYFYPPIAFWVSGLLDAAGLSTLTAVNLTGLGALAASGFSMYLWLKDKTKYALLGACAYMAAPYHLMDFYVRGALAEFVGFIWLPLIALGMQRIREGRSMILLALAYAALILTHLPTAMLATFFLIGPLAIFSIWKDRKTLTPLISAGSVGIGLSAFYLLPALTLQGHISRELLWTPHHLAANWTFYPVDHSLADPFMIAVALGMALLSIWARSIWTAITLVAAISAIGLIPLMWEIEPFASAQFPWRLLAIVEFAAITAAVMRRPPFLLLTAALACCVPAYASWRAFASFSIAEANKPEPVIPRFQDAPEYLPAGFDTRLVHEATRTANLAEWRTALRGDTITVTSPGEVTMGRSAFPIWDVTRDGNSVPYKGPFIRFQAQPGIYKIERRIIWQEWVGALISLCMALVVLLQLYRRRGQKQSTMGAVSQQAPFVFRAKAFD